MQLMGWFRRRPEPAPVERASEIASLLASLPARRRDFYDSLMAEASSAFKRSCRAVSIEPDLDDPEFAALDYIEDTNPDLAIELALSVARGATLLDVFEPGWKEDVLPGLHPMQVCEGGVLEQVFGSWREGYRTLLDSMKPQFDPRFPLNHGFAVPNPIQMPGYDENGRDAKLRLLALSELWRREVSTRRWQGYPGCSETARWMANELAFQARSREQAQSSESGLRRADGRA